MLQHLRVLVVEDDPHVQEIFCTVLAHFGYDVAVAVDAATTRSALGAADFHAIIIDVGLPGGENGISLAREVHGRGLPVILVTGHHQLEDILARTGFRYLLKPFHIDALEEAIIEEAQETGAQIAARHQSRAE